MNNKQRKKNNIFMEYVVVTCILKVGI